MVLHQFFQCETVDWLSYLSKSRIGQNKTKFIESTPILFLLFFEIFFNHFLILFFTVLFVFLYFYHEFKSCIIIFMLMCILFIFLSTKCLLIIICLNSLNDMDFYWYDWKSCNFELFIYLLLFKYNEYSENEWRKKRNQSSKMNWKQKKKMFYQKFQLGRKYCSIYIHMVLNMILFSMIFCIVLKLKKKSDVKWCIEYNFFSECQK